MTNKERYDAILTEDLRVTADQLPGLKYLGIPSWNSMTHMEIISDLEGAFRIRMETIDILRFSSYEKGMEILSGQYGVSFEEGGQT